jgi:hypothetical protein
MLICRPARRCSKAKGRAKEGKPGKRGAAKGYYESPGPQDPGRSGCYSSSTKVTSTLTL